MERTTTAPAPMSTAYEPGAVENKWSERWEDLGVFRMDVDPAKTPYSITCPPPNVTGSLHLGHATNGTIQDVLCRARRMQGYGVLWQGGTDHAGIATQNVVERKLRNERQVTRHDLGREAFLKEVWDWKQIYGDTIVNQYRRLGASLDYSRWRFTMDEGYTRAVRKAFVHLYNKGWIYRGNRIINWCPRCLTSLSDLEVVYKESESTLYHVTYALEDGSGSITVATVRPETILGDVAVAVHPEDERYQAMIGKKVRVPMTDRLVPVIADTHVEREFGTGCLKITPAHDPADYEIGERHGLPMIDVMTPEGTMSPAAGSEWDGMDRFEARKAAALRLKEDGVLVKEEAYKNNVTHCDRCATVIEPRLSDQWFVAMKELAAPAIKEVEENRIRFTPERWGGVYLDWLRNIKDWCVSRQLWWGHRIPVWTCTNGHASASVTDLDSCPVCSAAVEQDPDVLDTWFSSAMWPFATLGWPDKTPEFDYFYPTNVLSTARDIIYLWVARMVFMSMEFVHERPFSDVLIHATILDAKGQRMSKSKGTGVDPLDIMAKYGTDACRFWFAGAGTSSQDVRYTEDKIEAGRNFANKLWNASRFVLMNLPQGDRSELRQLELADRWILSRLQATIQAVNVAIETYHLVDATNALYEFVWTEFCDWYLEISKPRMQAGDETVKAVLREVLSNVLRLMHPFMPYITEEIYAQLVAKELVEPSETLLKTSWPTIRSQFSDPQGEAEMGLVMEIIRTVRNMRAELGVPPSKKAERLFIHASEGQAPILQAMQGTIAYLTRSEKVDVSLTAEDIPQAASGVAGENTLLLPLSGLLDIQKEIDRLNKEQGQLKAERERLDKQLSNEAFVSKAPAAVVDKLRARVTEVDSQVTAIASQLARWS